MQQMMTQNAQPQTLAQAPVPQIDRDRKHAMAEAWKSYRGDFPNPLKIDKDQPDDNVLSNFCVSIVDKGASWLFGEPLKIEATDETSKKETDIQDFINGLWGDDDDKMSLLSDAGTNGGVCGQAFLKLIPAQRNMKFPRIVVMDPMLVRMVTAPDDCTLVLAYIIEYSGASDWQKRQIIARIDPGGLSDVIGGDDLDETWSITNYARKGQLGSWFQVGEQDKWLYPFPPIFTNKNLPNPNEAWGTPDLTPDLIAQNKSLNFLLSNLARIVKFHGHPKTWAKGVGRSQISVNVDEVIVLESENGELNTIKPMDNFAGILSVIGTIMSNIDQQSRIPGVALGRQEQLPKLGQISGVALSLMFQPLIEKTKLKQRLYGKMIREITRAALVIAGKLDIADYEDYQIDLHWAPLLPSDNLAAAQEAVILQQLGVSLSTILSGLGLDADDEVEKKEAEDAKQLTGFSRGTAMPPALPPTPAIPSAPGQPVAPVAQPPAQPVGA